MLYFLYAILPKEIVAEIAIFDGRVFYVIMYQRCTAYTIKGILGTAIRSNT